MAGVSPEVSKISSTTLRGPSDCTTLITGGASGIGLETALLLHAISSTNRIVIVDRTAADSGKDPSLLSLASSKRVLFVQCDITDWKAQQAAFNTAVQQFGCIDNVFVNAGINEYGNQLFADDVDSDGDLKEPDKRVFSVDLAAALDTIKLAIHHIQRRAHGKKGGSIVLTASLAGYLGSAGAPLYSAAKHALVGLLRALKNDVAKLGIAISLIAPGITLTDLVAGRGPDESLDDWANRMRAASVPINSPAEVATVAAWLMSLGMQANGKGILIQAGMQADIESGLAINRRLWMSPKMLDLFKGGRNAPLFPNKL